MVKNIESKLARTAFNRNLEKLTEKTNSNHFTVVTFKKFHIVTVAKVMSTTLNTLADDNNLPCYDVNVSKDTLEIKTFTHHVGSKRRDGITNHFKEDWKNQLEGKSSKRDFIFLMRNPIDRFVTGFFEDNMVNLLNSFNHGDKSSTAWCRSFLELKKYKPEDIDLFLLAMNVDGISPWKHIENFKSSLIYDMYKDLVESLINSHFGNIHTNAFYSHHTRPYLLTYCKFLYNKQIDESKVKFLDIGKTDVIEYINETYASNLLNTKGNKRDNIMKDIITNGFKKHIITIINLLYVDIEVYSTLCKDAGYEHEVDNLIGFSLNKWYENHEGLI